MDPDPGYWIIFWDTDMNWYYTPDKNVASDVVLEVENIPYDKSILTAGWHSYEFKFGIDTFEFYMDDDLFFTYPVSHTDKTATFDTLNSVCIAASQGTANVYDNITATGTDSTTPPLSESNGGNAAYTILLFGSGSIIAISSVYTLNRWFKKKD